jgi:hypothetical protein
MQQANPPVNTNQPKKTWQTPECTKKSWKTPQFVPLKFTSTEGGTWKSIPEVDSGGLAS